MIDVAAIFAKLKTNTLSEPLPIPQGTTFAEVHRYSMIGCRVQVPVHSDAWMRGARYGVITSMRHGRNGFSDYANVKLDALPRGKRFKLWRLDWAYADLVSLPVGGRLL